MPHQQEPQLTVIYPLIEVRGRAVDRVRTWTHDQTLARERYRIIIASDGADPVQEKEVAALLGPHDEIIHAPHSSDAALCNAGAERVRTPWLIVTEGHCLADPGCLEAATRWLATNPTAVAGNFATRHPDSYLVARLTSRWYGVVQARWGAPGEWARLHRSGCMIRTDVFKTLGGFEPDYGLFAPPLMSARLDARGEGIETVPGAAVLHWDDDRMRDHHGDTADYVWGELAARCRNDPVFFERYFGHAPVWANEWRSRPRTARRMARAIVAAAIAYPRRLAELGRLLVPLLVPMTVGAGPRVALQRFAVKLDEIVVERFPLPASWRWARFLRAHARVIRLTQLGWAGGRPARAEVPRSIGSKSVDQLGPEAIVGVHALEEYRGRPFRWTEPVVLLRVAPSADEYELRIETGGIRGDPLAAVIAVVAGGRVLPRELLSAENGALVVRLTQPWSSSTRDGVVLVCSALAPAQAGSSDSRLLGLPVLSVVTRPLQTRARTGLAA